MDDWVFVEEINECWNKQSCIVNRFIFLRRIGFLFHNDFGVGLKKVFVVKADIFDDTKSVCYNAEFISIAEMPVHIHLLNGRIGGSVRRHGTIGGFVRVVGIIQPFCLFKCFELFYDTVGISVRSVQPYGRTWIVSPKGNPV